MTSGKPRLRFQVSPPPMKKTGLILSELDLPRLRWLALDTSPWSTEPFLCLTLLLCKMALHLALPFRLVMKPVLLDILKVLRTLLPRSKCYIKARNLNYII